MSLWKIAWRSIQQRAIASSLTALAVGLGVALVVAVLVIHGVVDKSFRRGGEGYDLIVGPKGGKLQLILNSVYYIEQSPGTLPYSYYEDNFVERLANFGPNIESAVPISMGHHFPGTNYQVVGTTAGFFDTLRYRDNKEYEFSSGRNFKDDAIFEGVIGSEVARRTGMGVGSKFQTAAGEVDRASIHQEEFTVVGVLEPTSTPVDRALYVNLKGFYEIHGIAHEALDKSGSTNEEQTPPPADPTPQGPSVEAPPAAPETTSESAAATQSPEAEAPAVDEHADHDHAEHATEDADHDHAGHDHAEHAAEDADHAGHDHAGHDHAEHATADGDHDGHDHADHAGHDHAEGETCEAANHGEPGHVCGEGCESCGAADHGEPGHVCSEGETCGAEDHGEPGHVCGEGCSHELEVSAILVCVDRWEPGIARKVAQQINRSTVAQAVEPAVEIHKFFQGVVGNIQLVLLILAIITVVVAGMGIMVSIYNSMSERRHEIAIMRALGASRATVMIVILLESILLSLGGGVIGILMGHGLIAVLGPTIESSTGVFVSAFQFQLVELVLIPGLIVLASLVGYLPALVAYRTDVARSLTQHP